MEPASALTANSPASSAPRRGPHATANNAADTVAAFKLSGMVLNADTPAVTASVAAVSAGSSAMARSAPNTPTFPDSIAILSIYSSAF